MRPSTSEATNRIDKLLVANSSSFRNNNNALLRHVEVFFIFLKIHTNLSTRSNIGILIDNHTT
eukprot:m.256541 g.256541  ORF g.256541 m.256541 type:complete len:63 (+) comp21881_c0_seq1:1211-1399(+)